MPKTITEYKCLLISPGDVEDERAALTELALNWNAQIGQALNAKVDLVKWESHSTPEMGGEAQSILNKQLVDNCDFGIAIFWSKLGTPTENYDSGSVEELRKLIDRGARVLIYFSKQPIPQEILNIEQYNKLQEFKEEIKNEGLLGGYIDIPNLREQVQLHLTSVIVQLLSKDRPEIGELTKPEATSLQKPDIRLKTSPGFVSTPLGVKGVIIVEVQNHSPMVVFTGMVNIQLKNKNKLVIACDPVTGEHQKRRELRPGEKFSMHFFPEAIFDKVRPDEISHVVITDDIDRVYESDPNSFQWVLNEFWGKYKK